MGQQVVKTQSRIFYGYWIVLAAFLIQVIMNGCTYYNFGLFVLPIESEFHWSRAGIMTASMLTSFVSGFASPFVGRISYRWGARRVITAGALLMAACYAFLSLTQSLWHFYVFFAIAGLGSAATGVIPISIVITNWFKKRRGFAIGIVGMGIGLGGFVIPPILSYVIPAYGWRVGYLLSGILLAAVIVPLALFVVKPTPSEMGLLQDNGDVGEDKHSHASKGPEPGFALKRALKTPAFWLMSVSFMAFSFGSGHTFTNQVPHLEDIGFTAVVAATTVQAVGIGSAAGKFGFGWLCDYIPPKYILIIGSALEAAATIILITVNSSTTEHWLWIYGILMGLGMGCWFPSLSMTTGYTFGLIDYGVIFGIFYMLYNIGGAIGPVVGGYIFDTTRSYYLAFIICLIGYGIAIPTMFLVRPPKMKNDESR